MAEIHYRHEQYPTNVAAERHYHAATQHGHEAAEHAQQSLSNFTHYLQDKTPPAQRIVAIISLLPLSGFLLFLSGMTLTATVIGMAITTPLLVIFSPIILPAVFVMGLAVTGFVASGAFGLAAASSLSWTVNYVTRRWRGGGVLEGFGEIVGQSTKGVGQGIQDVGAFVGQKTKDVGQGIEDKSREVGQERGWDRDLHGVHVGAGQERGWDRDPHVVHVGAGWRNRDDVMKTRTTGPGDLVGHVQQSISNFIHYYIQDKPPAAQHIVAITTIFPISGFLLLLSGLTLTATIIGIAVSTPPFIIFSPIILPAIFFIGLALIGFIASGAFAVTGASSLLWIMNYVRRWRLKYYQRTRRGGGGGVLEELGELVGETTKGIGQGMQDVGDYVGQKTKDVGQGIEDKSREVGQQRGQDGDVGADVTVRTKEVKARGVGGKAA